MHTVSSCGGCGCQVQDCDGLLGIQSVCKGMSAKGDPCSLLLVPL